MAVDSTSRRKDGASKTSREVDVAVSDCEADDDETGEFEENRLLDAEPTLTKDDPKPPKKWRTLGLMGLVSFMEGADASLLPASFKALEFDLGLSPEELGSMSLAQSLFMAVAFPIWGALADRVSRRRLLIQSCSAWALLTLLLAMTATKETMLILRCMHGAMLAAMSPIGQSVVADVTPSDNELGTAFGAVLSPGALGAVVTAVLCTPMASKTYPGSRFLHDFYNSQAPSPTQIEGWKIAFSIVALASLATAGMLYLFMEEPRGEARDSRVYHQPARVSYQTCVRQAFQRLSAICREELSGLFEKLCIRSFAILLVQGLFGSMPWNALSFLTMYLQYSGHSDESAPKIVSMISMGKICGYLAGGRIADHVKTLSPEKGRPLTCVFSVLSGIPTTVLLIELASDATAGVLASLAFMLGFTACWCGAVNRAMIKELLGEPKASIFSWMIALDGCAAAFFGAPVVGFLAEGVFGFEAPPRGIVPSLEVQVANKSALRQAMLCATTGPWMLCAAFYVRLCFTYSDDVTKPSQK